MSEHSASRTSRWWERGVIYQIYPRSFMDSDGDGVGDLAGIEQRLDYVATLGVDAIWLSPIYPSPMADFGYDVADYGGIEPMFGTIDDFDRLLAGAHERGLKLLLDFVPNHSSDRHPWFVESRSGKNSPKRDWYIWAPPGPDGGPPNNWISDFGGSSWEWDEASGEYYLHAFLKEQPDLNWRNPAVEAAMFDAMRFWLDRGVDGFRIDVLWHIVKAEGFPDNPPNPDWHAGLGQRDLLIQRHSTDQPEAHAIAARMRRLADDYGDRLLVGEIFLPNDRLARWHGTSEAPEVHLPFNFALIENPWDAATIGGLIAAYEDSLPSDGWPNWVYGSHDAARIAARIGEPQARVAAMLLLTLRGTPTLYQGDELGIGEVSIPPHRVRDPRELREPGLGLGRDRSRTPMPWTGREPNAGFTTGEPWLPLNGDWPTRNVEAQDADRSSILWLYRNLLALRRRTDALAIGAYHGVEARGDLLMFDRAHGDHRTRIALNFGEAAINLRQSGQVLLSTLGAGGTPSALRPNEGLIFLPGEPL